MKITNENYALSHEQKRNIEWDDSKTVSLLKRPTPKHNLLNTEGTFLPGPVIHPEGGQPLQNEDWRQPPSSIFGSVPHAFSGQAPLR